MFSNLLMTGLVMVAILTRTGRAIPGTGVTGLYDTIHGNSNIVSEKAAFIAREGLMSHVMNADGSRDFMNKNECSPVETFNSCFSGIN